MKMQRLVSMCLLVLAGAGLSCATIGSRAPSVGLQVAGTAPDATVWIDDRLSGRLSDFARPGKRLPVGFHRIEVRAPGYYSQFEEVEARPGTDVAIRADLRAILD